MPFGGFSPKFPRLGSPLWAKSTPRSGLAPLGAGLRRLFSLISGSCSSTLNLLSKRQCDAYHNSITTAGQRWFYAAGRCAQLRLQPVACNTEKGLPMPKSTHVITVGRVGAPAIGLLGIGGAGISSMGSRGRRFPFGFCVRQLGLLGSKSAASLSRPQCPAGRRSPGRLGSRRFGAVDRSTGCLSGQSRFPAPGSPTAQASAAGAYSSGARAQTSQAGDRLPLDRRQRQQSGQYRVQCSRSGLHPSRYAKFQRRDLGTADRSAQPRTVSNVVVAGRRHP